MILCDVMWLKVFSHKKNKTDNEKKEFKYTHIFQKAIIINKEYY